MAPLRATLGERVMLESSRLVRGLIAPRVEEANQRRSELRSYVNPSRVKLG